MTVLGHTLGFPRIGLYRELKYALEQYWNGEIDQNKLIDIGRMLRIRHWKQQIKSGIDLIPVGDFSWYDHVLTTSAMLNNIPPIYKFHTNTHETNTLDTLFNVARGYSTEYTTIAPSEMKKWFNTNYHYIVPEFTKNQEFKLNWTQLLDEIDEALHLNHPIKPILLGPITYLWLGKEKGEEKFNRLSLLSSLIKVYQEILDILSKKNITWIQIDEPALVLELPKEWSESYLKTYQKLKNNKNIKLLLTTYFDGIDHQLNIIKQLSVDGIHVDLTSNSNNNISYIHNQLPKNWILSAGIINGRNIWKTNLYAWFQTLYPISQQRTIWIGSSCSLLHSPIDLNLETKLPSDIKNWFAFALQKCSEIKILCDTFNNIKNNNNIIDHTEKLKQYYNANIQRVKSYLVQNNQVKERCQNIKNLSNNRVTKYKIRQQWQQKKFNLPIYPITTIGSFPQTQEIRNLRLQFKNKQINEESYYKNIKKYIKQNIEEQEKLDLDILVHGEPERNDMVEYFSEHLSGCILSQNGWVQSYGSRCVKPPIIIGDIHRPYSITKQWINYAQSLTKKPVKGILTGPVTIMNWSFIREDIERNTIALQLALAIQDEVMDLEKSGISIIQIDEPALIEGLPLKISEQNQCLKWAINAFKITVSLIQNDTQIHTHICYSEFNEIIIHNILKLDADVISIEASRSDLTFLQYIQKEINNLNSIGPGLYDIHCKNIPSIHSLIKKINQFLQYIPKDKLWINPDCGLKTRSWTEIKHSLTNIVNAVKILRKNEESSIINKTKNK